MKKLGLIASVLVAVVLLGACHKTAATNARNTETRAAGIAADNLLRSQPIPIRPWSQLRQNLIELETSQADTTQTTTFFFNQGVQQPVQECPSIGFPIPSTTELTNPEQKIQGHDVTLPQLETTGVYPGVSTGTYVICIDGQGRAYADYWEGFVQAVTGPAKWDSATHSISLIGPPSFKFSTEKKP